MAKTKKKTRQEKLTPTIESPTWGNVQQMAARVMDLLGGNVECANKLSYSQFYALCMLASLRLDPVKAGAPIFGTKFLS